MKQTSFRTVLDGPPQQDEQEEVKQEETKSTLKENQQPVQEKPIDHQPAQEPTQPPIQPPADVEEKRSVTIIYILMFISRSETLSSWADPQGESLIIQSSEATQQDNS